MKFRLLSEAQSRLIQGGRTTRETSQTVLSYRVRANTPRGTPFASTICYPVRKPRWCLPLETVMKKSINDEIKSNDINNNSRIIINNNNNRRTKIPWLVLSRQGSTAYWNRTGICLSGFQDSKRMTAPFRYVKTHKRLLLQMEVKRLFSLKIRRGRVLQGTKGARVWYQSLP